MATDLFLHNWSAVPTLEVGFLTDVSRSARRLSEERRALVRKPYRSIAVQWTSMPREDAYRQILRLMRASDARIRLPLYPDQSEVTAAGAVGATVNCNTTFRRFYVGRQVAVVNPFVCPITGEVATIQAIDPAFLTLTGALSTSYPEGSFVYPLITVKERLSGRQQFFTDYNASEAQEFVEVEGATALPPLEPINSTVGFPTFQGLPVLTIPIDWSDGFSWRVVRPGKRYALGLADGVFLRGERPLVALDLSFTFCKREDAWELIRFFQGRAGRWGLFFLVLPAAVWELVAIGLTFVEIAFDPVSLTDLTEFVDYVGVVLKDGTVHVREVGSVASTGTPSWRFNLTTPLPAIAPEDVERVAPAHRCRFEEDTLVESWLTTTVAQIDVSVIEVLDEKTVEVADI